MAETISPGTYVVYILRSTTSPDKFYCGSTNNIHRRIRQHNGEISGGAKYTTGYRPWAIAAIIASSEEALTKGEALRVEYYTKAKNVRSIDRTRGDGSHHPAYKSQVGIPRDCPVRRRKWLIEAARTSITKSMHVLWIDDELATCVV